MAKKAKKAAGGRKQTKRASANRQRIDRASETTEIVFSYAEIDFLRKITKRDESDSQLSQKARLALRDKLLDINFSQPMSGGGGLIVLELAQPEVDFLQRITKEVYSFITAEERRARLILREKILIAFEKLTGEKIQVDEPA